MFRKKKKKKRRDFYFILLEDLENSSSPVLKNLCIDSDQLANEFLTENKYAQSD